MPAALFDLDETLLDRTSSLNDFLRWQSGFLFKNQIEKQEAFIKRFLVLDNKGMVWKDKVYESLIQEFNLEGSTVDDLLNSYMTEFATFCKPRRGAFEVVSAFLEKGFVIGLVTNGKTPFQERNFEALGFGSLFSCIVVSEAVGMRKPDKAIFEFACDLLDSDLGSSFFIGDNPVSDMQGAKAAGMRTIYVPTDSHCAPCVYADETYFDLNRYAEQIKDKC